AKIIPYQNLSPYSYEDLTSAAVLIPSALVGTFAGAYLTKRISDVWFFRFIQFGLFVLSIKLTVDAVRELLV
ncbi:MAG: sulfite exporter TauE/SafE family protein, partial [Betaproteobacteria bacterium]|nr:sulfite exporter TauE/SafE family protein [Betaproteobacteria bacterium]